TNDASREALHICLFAIGESSDRRFGFADATRQVTKLSDNRCLDHPCLNVCTFECLYALNRSRITWRRHDRLSELAPGEIEFIEPLTNVLQGDERLLLGLNSDVIKSRIDR